MKRCDPSTLYSHSGATAIPLFVTADSATVGTTDPEMANVHDFNWLVGGIDVALHFPFISAAETTGFAFFHFSDGEMSPHAANKTTNGMQLRTFLSGMRIGERPLWAESRHAKLAITHAQGARRQTSGGRRRCSAAIARAAAGS